MSVEEAKKVTKFKKADKVCDGRYVWRCKPAKEGDCDTYPMGSEY